MAKGSVQQLRCSWVEAAESLQVVLEVCSAWTSSCNTYWKSIQFYNWLLEASQDILGHLKW